LASLADLAACIGLPSPKSWHRVRIEGITDDSRDVRPGWLFVAIPGAQHDGADFVDDAQRQRAVAVVCERPCELDVPVLVVPDARAALAALAAAFHGHPTRSLFTSGVTGTNGKTTVCHIAAHLLGADTPVIGTVANEARGLRAVTTPKSTIIQSIARDARFAGHRNLVIEASSIGLAQHRLDAVDFDAAVFTNLSRDHRDFHGSREAYLAAKASLFRGLKPDAVAIVHLGDPAASKMLDASAGRSLTFAIDCDADLVARDVRLVGYAARFLSVWRGETTKVFLPLPGRHNVENALAAIGIGLAAGRSLGELAARARSVPGVPGRCQVFRRSDGVTAVVDFAHSPDALARVLAFLATAHSRIIVVFGCPGSSDRGKREQMGEIAARLAGFTVITSDNPKYEDPGGIADEIAVGVARGGGRYELVLDRAEAIGVAAADARSEDVVLVAGKGHETYQIVEDRFEAYSDEAVLQEFGFVPLAGDAA